MSDVLFTINSAFAISLTSFFYLSCKIAPLFFMCVFSGFEY